MSPELNIAKDRLLHLGPQRVWSLLVTVFGELAQNAQDSIQGPTLSVLMQEMHVKPEALRVALHRLRNDGWIKSTKAGRTSLHALTPQGLKESAAASPRIYARPENTPDHWQMIVLPDTLVPDTDALSRSGFAQLMPRVFIGASGATAPQQALVLQGAETPDWVAQQLEASGLAAEYDALDGALAKLQDTLDVAPLSALDRAVLRILIVHAWRRLALRHPQLPRKLYTPTWKGHACREKVAALLGALPKPDLADIR